MLYVCLFLVILVWHIIFLNIFIRIQTINKIDVSGKSLLDATKQFEKVIETYELTIGDEGVEEESIYGKNIHLKYASNKEIQEVLKQQNVWSWIADIFQKKTKTVKFNVEYDETLLDEQINQLKILKEEQIPGENAKPVFNGEQFVIQKETNGTGIDYEKLKKDNREEDKRLRI